ncbi:histone-lysine N-methyltransferase EZ3-like isoform X1 [Dioscorea cayenensis subsp. rotundata]|uniref:Histone-lysine N-methyltransferase EZ3-like isoform X1 n=1 Tax=Dioscorea cayennensis subsp. rotundata TaxID=55577 RepID=A0AB40BQ65_DIOCR|nr:histone-lysine N-methyltransferase EZ3-like isoform X1 [Dioscorea cayenensis subsp. rotundata]
MLSSSSSGAADLSSMRSKRPDGDHSKDAIHGISSKISQVKKETQASRLIFIRERVEKNRMELEEHSKSMFELAKGRGSDGSEHGNLLSVRMGSPLGKFGVLDSWEREGVNVQDENLSSGTVVFGSNGGKCVVRLIRLPFVEKIPPYTTWMFLDRNQRMAEDQSVVGRRQIYYDDKYGSETLICSDSEEEIIEPEEEKHKFSKGEDEIIWKVLQEHGVNPQALNVLSQSIYVNPSEIEKRYETLMKKNQDKGKRNTDSSAELESDGKLFLDKTLSSALDSFDTIFCRRCLVFDCRLHGCPQNLILPNEKLSSVFEPEELRTPCGDNCYLKRIADAEGLSHGISNTGNPNEIESMNLMEKLDTTRLDSEDSTPDDDSKDSTEPEGMSIDGITTTLQFARRNKAKRKVSKNENTAAENSQSTVEKCVGTIDKKQKILSGEDTFKNADSGDTDNFPNKTLDSVMEYDRMEKISSSSDLGQTSQNWNALEKDLYLKGVEIFGKNSCLIARNLLSGLKTCAEVSNYMFEDKGAIPSRPLFSNSTMEDSEKVDGDYLEQEMPRTRIWRRRGKARKLKYTWKSAGHPSVRKRIADGKQELCTQYNPCGCLQMCGKQCPCMQDGTCCEKYCGCSKSCKNRFRGCHCAKSQCRSRQCPCFAAGRECDPDVCRNCWVSCGDGSLGEPPARGDGYQCGNMKLLLKQQQRILLGRSDVAGWGAFIKNPVNKNDYLGEYTGELISHKEADKRGKIYDRANSSFLFDLNDQYVLDAYRKGDKLKFANHSSNPNCYAKVMLVAGDHRVGIFAKEHIEASEELFYDYRYGPDQAPAWARKPEGSKKDDPSVSHGRAQKVA